jgi:hypothetical protein
MYVLYMQKALFLRVPTPLPDHVLLNVDILNMDDSFERLISLNYPFRSVISTHCMRLASE